MKTSAYKGVRKSEVRFKHSLLKFSLAFLAVFFLGIFTNIYIQKIPLKTKILDSLSIPQKYNFEMDEPRFHFHSGLMPVIGIFVNRMQLQEKKCPIQKLEVHDTLIRLSPISLIMGRVKKGRVDINYASMTLAKDCGVKDSADQNEDNQLPIKKIFKKSQITDKASSKNISHFFSQLDQFTQKQPIEKLHVDKVHINYFDSLSAPIIVEGVLVADFNEQLELEFDLSRTDFRSHQLDFLKSKVKAEWNKDGLALKVKSKVREGKLKVQLNVEKKEPWNVDLSVSLDKLPLSTLSAHFLQFEGLKYLWASCQIQLQSELDLVFKKSLKIKSCSIDGPYGEVAIRDTLANLEKIEKFDLEMSKVDLDQVIDNKRDIHLSGIFSRYGVFSARAIYQDEKLEVKGLLENSDIVFSNNNLRDIQKVNKIPFSFSGNASDWLLKIKDVDIDEGLFKGDFYVNAKKSHVAQGRLAIHRLRLSPKIYQLMLNSMPADLRVYGKFSVKNKNLKDWSVMLATPHLQSEFYDFKNLKVKGESGEAALAKLKITVGNGVFKGKSPMFSWIQPTQLEENWNGVDVSFKELSTRLEVFKNRSVSWKRGYVHFENGWQFSSEGARDSSRHVTAWLQWDRPDRKFMKWNYRGEFFKGQWLPETPWVRNWLQENPRFLKSHNNITLEGT